MVHFTHNNITQRKRTESYDSSITVDDYTKVVRKKRIRSCKSAPMTKIMKAVDRSTRVLSHSLDVLDATSMCYVSLSSK